MKTLRYLNTVLTVIAVLLTLNVYVQLTGTPAGSAVSIVQEANAADRPPRGVGSANAAQLSELKSINENINRLAGKLTDGSIRVKVDSIPAQSD